MAYATAADVQARMTRTLTENELSVCTALLCDASTIIDAYRSDASANAKRAVACRMVIRALGTDVDIPQGATQGSMSGLGYSQSWTIGSGGGVGELYLAKSDKLMLGGSNSIGIKSPLEDMTYERNNSNAL